MDVPKPPPHTQKPRVGNFSSDEPLEHSKYLNILDQVLLGKQVSRLHWFASGEIVD